MKGMMMKAVWSDGPNGLQALLSHRGCCHSQAQ